MAPPLQQLQLIEPLVLLLLMTDVRPDHLFVSTDGRDEVPPRPEMLPDEVLPPLPAYPRYVDRTLALDVTHHLRNGTLRRNPN